MKKKLIMAAMIFLGFSPLANAQWNWPQGEEEAAKEKNVLYTDYVKQKDFASAEEPMEWLLEKAPNLNKSLYINGAKVYEGLSKKNKENKELRVQYADKAMALYDKRIEFFGQKENVLNRKALASYALYIRDKEKYQFVFNTMKEAFEVNGSKIYDQNLVAYMDISRRLKKHNPEALDDKSVFLIYEQVTSILEEKVKSLTKAGKDTKKLEAKWTKIDELLAGTVKVDCDMIQANLEPKYRENPSDLKMAKFLLKLCIVGKCMDLQVFLDAAAVVNEADPTYGLSKILALKHKQNKNYDEALKFYDQAIALTEDNVKKAEMSLEKASVYSKRGQLSKARSEAMSALQNDPTLKEAYSIIGNLYMNSYESCKKGVNKVEDRAVFIAAYDMYAKAGNSKGMNAAKSQFPSGEEIFTYNMNVGDPLTVGCWINKSVTVRKRD
ncbi:tetratricopeptide repeat protein [Aureibacter tunicatorum]|uniref:Tetratricopeptide (TPR) repeat protein n=1 Tax=Aureibacter tunicatorum TaxID=866807 RepID=A0AAE3XJ76_9BACT|nr:tetratricopeptide repeat protein [Aureibacter tunicatorum]MDR6237395.1 tetratricopeptide (TPR) repeat protein [Aureibacter tunicatorum]BDD06385.1 hypothetical protein AUTU_38680 [Aureibacter tunicatorum]